MELRAFSDQATIEIRGHQEQSIAPVPFDEVEEVIERRTTHAEFTQLPDFSYGLWDWASGNETCPLTQASSVQQCHDFEMHLGAVNTYHFLPQGEHIFKHYHRLALERATECVRLFNALLPAPQGKFAVHVEECENEALLLEAIGHHYLHDAWSSGHMWGRWGRPELDAVYDLTRARLVGLTAGMVHGAKAVTKFKDAMCTPYDDVNYIAVTGRPTPMVGDLYLPQLFDPDGKYKTQRASLLSCAVSSLHQVMRKLGLDTGTGIAPDVIEVEPTGPDCFAQRATNAAIVHGMGLDIPKVVVLGFETPDYVPLDHVLIYGSTPVVAGVEIDIATRLKYRDDLINITVGARKSMKKSPLGTQVASGVDLEPLLGAMPNHYFASVPAFADPVTSSTSIDATAQQRLDTIRLLLHRSHAKDWCERLSEVELARIVDHVEHAANRSVACEACTEIIGRHIRLGEPGDTYAAEQQPLCHFLAPSAALLHTGKTTLTDRIQAAREYCGCGCDPRAEMFEGMQVHVERVPGAVAQFSPSDMTLTGVGPVTVFQYHGAPATPYMGNLLDELNVHSADSASLHMFQWEDRTLLSGTFGFPTSINNNFINRYGHGNLIAVWKDSSGDWQWAWSITGGAYLLSGGITLLREYQFVASPWAASPYRLETYNFSDTEPIGLSDVRVEVILPKQARCLRLSGATVQP